MGSVPLLPQELGGAQKQPRPHLPAHHVRPLVDEEGQVPVGADPFGVQVADDGLRGGAHYQWLLQLLPPSVGHHRELGRKTLDVFRLLPDEGVRDEQREVGVLVPGFLEPSVQGGLDVLPQGIAVGADDHAPPDRGVVGELGPPDDLGVPLGEVLAAWRYRVCHLVSTSFSRCLPGNVTAFFRLPQARLTRLSGTAAGPGRRRGAPLGS